MFCSKALGIVRHWHGETTIWSTRRLGLWMSRSRFCNLPSDWDSCCRKTFPENKRHVVCCFCKLVACAWSLLILGSSLCALCSVRATTDGPCSVCAWPQRNLAQRRWLVFVKEMPGGRKHIAHESHACFETCKPSTKHIATADAMTTPYCAISTLFTDMLCVKQPKQVKPQTGCTPGQHQLLMAPSTKHTNRVVTTPELFYACSLHTGASTIYDMDFDFKTRMHARHVISI